MIKWEEVMFSSAQMAFEERPDALDSPVILARLQELVLEEELEVGQLLRIRNVESIPHPRVEAAHITIGDAFYRR